MDIFVCGSGFALQDIRCSLNEDPVLQCPCTTSSVCEGKGVIRVWLKVTDQLLHGVAIHLHSLAVVQDLQAEETNHCIPNK